MQLEEVRDCTCSYVTTVFVLQHSFTLASLRLSIYFTMWP